MGLWNQNSSSEGFTVVAATSPFSPLCFSATSFANFVIIYSNLHPTTRSSCNVNHQYICTCILFVVHQGQNQKAGQGSAVEVWSLTSKGRNDNQKYVCHPATNQSMLLIQKQKQTYIFLWWWVIEIWLKNIREIEAKRDLPAMFINRKMIAKSHKYQLFSSTQHFN